MSFLLKQSKLYSISSLLFSTNDLITKHFSVSLTHNTVLVMILLLPLSKDIRAKYIEHDNVSCTRKGHAAVPQFADAKYMCICMILHYNHISDLLPACMIASLWYTANYMTLWENRQKLNSINLAWCRQMIPDLVLSISLLLGN